MGTPFFVGIAGGTGSGKTTLARRIARTFGSRCLLVSCDSYYRAHPDLTLEERARLNYDHPDELDMPLLLQHMARLRAGEAIEMPTYDFTLHQRSRESILCLPAPLVLVEGVLALENAALRACFDLRLFVDTDDDVRFIRRLQRDIRHRGRDMDSVIRQYLDTVKPMHELFVYPSRRWADIIIPEGGENAAALAMITDAIGRRIGPPDP